MELKVALQIKVKKQEVTTHNKAKNTNSTYQKKKERKKNIDFLII